MEDGSGSYATAAVAPGFARAAYTENPFSRIK